MGKPRTKQSPKYTPLRPREAMDYNALALKDPAISPERTSEIIISVASGITSSAFHLDFEISRGCVSPRAMHIATFVNDMFRNPKQRQIDMVSPTEVDEVYEFYLGKEKLWAGGHNSLPDPAKVVEFTAITVLSYAAARLRHEQVSMWDYQCEVGEQSPPYIATQQVEPELALAS